MFFVWFEVSKVGSKLYRKITNNYGLEPTPNNTFCEKLFFYVCVHAVTHVYFTAWKSLYLFQMGITIFQQFISVKSKFSWKLDSTKTGVSTGISYMKQPALKNLLKIHFKRQKNNLDKPK